MWIQAFIQPTLIKSFCETGNLSYPGNMELKRIISYLTKVSIVRKIDKNGSDYSTEQ